MTTYQVGMTTYQVGDVIDLPPEPPVGTHAEGSDGTARVCMVRDPMGWRINGRGRAFDWTTVFMVEWFPLRITRVPGSP
jgi:hypothetical protein